MIELGLSRSQMEVYEDALRQTRQQRRVEVQIHGADEKRIDALSDPENVILGGSIQVDTTADVTRSLSLTMTDEKRRLAFDSVAPSRGAVYTNRFISVKHGIWVDDFEDWVDCPTFFGPVTGFSQDDDQITLEAQGKESLMLAPHLATEGYSIKKKSTMEFAIKLVARKAGEDKFDVDDFGHKLKQDKPVRPKDEPWRVLAGRRDEATGASGGLCGWGETDRIAFYDGRGILNVRRIDKNVVYTFRDDVLVSTPTYEFDMLEFRNHVIGKGQLPAGKGKGDKKDQELTIVRSLPANHPLSPESLQRNDKPRYLAEFVEAKSLKKKEDLIKRVEDVLEEKSTTSLTASYECLPIPHLEEGDKVRVKDGKTSVEFVLRQFTLPLTHDEPMTVGANRKIKQTWKRKRHKPIWWRG